MTKHCLKFKVIFIFFLAVAATSALASGAKEKKPSITFYDGGWPGVQVDNAITKYIIEGDPEKGVPPLAPDLKSVTDLIKYKHLFATKDTPKKDAG